MRGNQGYSGSELLRNAGGITGEIVDSVHRAKTIITDISAASNEQSTGIEQVNRAVVQMDEVTQQNAALVEEASAAAAMHEVVCPVFRHGAFQALQRFVESGYLLV